MPKPCRRGLGALPGGGVLTDRHQRHLRRRVCRRRPLWNISRAAHGLCQLIRGHGGCAVGGPTSHGECHGACGTVVYEKTTSHRAAGRSLTSQFHYPLPHPVQRTLSFLYNSLSLYIYLSPSLSPIQTRLLRNQRSILRTSHPPCEKTVASKDPARYLPTNNPTADHSVLDLPL